MALLDRAGRSHPLWWSALVLVLLSLLATASPAPAQTPSGAPSEEPSASRGPSDTREAERFLDALVRLLGLPREDQGLNPGRAP